MTLLAIICTWPGWGLRGTTAVVLRSPYRIVLAADSRTTYGQGQQASECKLFEMDDVFATVSGLARYGSAYRATDAVRAGFALPGSFQQHVTATASFLRRSVDNLAFGLHASNPAAYRYVMGPARGPADVVQLAVAEMVNGRPMLGLIELQRQPGTGALTVRTSICPGNCRQGDAAFYLGYWEQIRPYAAGRSVGSAASVDRLIRMEIHAHPAEVGAPVNILELTNAGPHWLENGGNCYLPGVR